METDNEKLYLSIINKQIERAEKDIKRIIKNRDAHIKHYNRLIIIEKEKTK